MYDKVNPGVAKKNFYVISINSTLNDKNIAYSSGLGAFTRSSLLSINNKGTKFVIGSLLLNYEIKYSAKELRASPCGNCTACTNGCPGNAISEDSHIDKKKCIQHLSGIDGWDINTITDLMKPFWGNRFFGCTLCTDICPLNRKTSKNTILPSDLPGYIGTTFPVDSIKNITSGYLKNRFVNNQLSAGWIPETALIRNLLFYYYIHNDVSTMKEFYGTMRNRGFNGEEINVIGNFINSLTNL